MTETIEFDLAHAGARVEGTGPRAWAAEARAMLKLAWPLVITQLAQIAVMTTDVMMLGRLSETALAAAALGNTVFFFVWLIGCGPSAAVAPMIAHILGADPMERAGVRAVVRMGLWAVAILWLPLGAILALTKYILLALHQDTALAEAAGVFVLPLCLGLPLSLGFQVLRNYATALGRPNTPLVVMALTIAFNFAGDYALIFGHFGLPRLGLFGSGMASACSFAFSFLAMLGAIRAAPALARYDILRRFSQPDWDRLAELFRLGLPIGLTMIFEAMLFNAATFLMGAFGTDAVAAHQIAVNIASVTFMVPLGIAMASTVRVGLAAGAGDAAGVRRAGYIAMLMAAAFMSLCAVMLAVFRHGIATLYFSGGGAETARTIALCARFIAVAAAFQVFDGLQVTAALSLRGLKDAHAPMWIAAGSYWLAGFPVAAGLAFGFGLEGFGVWIGLAFGLFVAALSMFARFYRLSHRSRELARRVSLG